MYPLTRKKKKLSTYVIDDIKGMIREGMLQEGDRLPNQNEFASQLGVSRASLREAFQTLSELGVIQQKPGLGTVIVSSNLDLWEKSPEPPLVSDRSATIELLEARKHLEGTIAALAARGIGKEQLKLIEDDIKQMKIALDHNRIEEYRKHDLSFHLHIAYSSHNRYLIHMYITLCNLMDRFMKEVFTEMPELIPKSFNHHVQIFKNIKARDQQQTVRCMKEHINDIEKNLNKYYKNVQ